MIRHLNTSIYHSRGMLQFVFVEFCTVVDQDIVRSFQGVFVPREGFCNGVWPTEELGRSGLDTDRVAWSELLVLAWASAYVSTKGWLCKGVYLCVFLD
jgi:hypothetical protein